MLAFLPCEECEVILGEMPFTRFNENTITSRDRFLEELEDVRAKGYAVDRGEELEGVHCVAAPVFNHRGRPLASIWVTGPSSRLRLEDFSQVGALVIEKAHAISQRFGYAVL
jgi:DNA-binding IclR family transcriptional regulator